MVKIFHGERIDSKGGPAIACSAFFFDAAAESLLLVKRAHNGRWVLPGGCMEPGETPAMRTFMLGEITDLNMGPSDHRRFIDSLNFRGEVFSATSTGSSCRQAVA